MPWWNLSKQKRSLETALDSELQHHLDQLIHEKVAAGIQPDQARREAILEFGDPEQLKEEIRDVHRMPILETALANLRYAWRMTRKSPSFSIAVILTLALGIGANSAVFSAINAILLRPLSFPDSGQLVILQQFDKKAKGPSSFVAPARLEDWNRLNTTFQAISGYYTEDISDLSCTIPEKVTEALVAPRFLQVWGISPLLGRDFTSAEEHFGGPAAVIISHRYWVHRFNANPNVIGKQIRLERSSYTVAGVMPAGFRFRDTDVDIWAPSPPDAPYARARESTWFSVFGRLKPAVTISEASANLVQLQAQLGRQFPKTDRQLSIDVQSLKDVTTQSSGKSLWILFGAVTLLLLIACTNIAALLLARATQREREISVRFSLGASRSSIILQLLSECFLLAIIGATLGLCVASAGSALFRHFASGYPRVDEVTLDTRIVVYTFVCAIAATFLCGLAPALQASRRHLNSRLSRFSRSQVSARNPLHWLLAGTQVALAVTLLVGSGLMLRSFQELGRVSLGFEPSHILTFRISANWGETTNYKALIRRIDRTLDAIAATPGVISAATAASLPGIPADARTDIKISEISSVSRITAESRFVSAAYFATLEIPLLTGEACAKTSVESPTVLVNRSFANTYLNAVPPLGRHIEFVSSVFQQPPARILGMVADAREQGVNHVPVPTIYWCSSAPIPSPYFLVRTEESPMAIAEALRKKIQTLEPSRSVFGLSPLEQHLTDNFSETRLRTILLTCFALTAVLLASTGLYGTLSYLVNVRRREVGLRLALGAARQQIVSGFLFKGVAVSLTGVFAGLCLALSFSNTFAGMLFGVTPTDATTLVGVTALVLAVGLCASLIPAVRAARLEPMQVLREE